MFFDHYPYTNFHNVNLDWVLQAVKSWGATVDANNLAFIDLKAANESFKAYVTSYLQDLDVSEEINDKLDQMLADGVLAPYMAPYIQTDVSAWLAQHITPTTPAVDSSLTISGAAADAAKTGEIRDSYASISHNINVTTIASGEDLNNYTTVGTYKITTQGNASGIANTPSINGSPRAGKLIVMKTSDYSHIFQIYILNYSRGFLAVRTRGVVSTDGWSEWNIINPVIATSITSNSENPVTSGAVYNALLKYLDLSHEVTNVAEGTDLDTLTSVGNYKVTTITIARSLINAPIIADSARAGKIIVFKTSDTFKIFQIYILNYWYGIFAIRSRGIVADDTWSDWHFVNPIVTSLIAEDSTNPVSSGAVYTALRDVLKNETRVNNALATNPTKKRIPLFAPVGTSYLVDSIQVDGIDAKLTQGICTDGRYLYYNLAYYGESMGRGVPQTIRKWDTWTNTLAGTSIAGDYGHCEDLCFVPAWAPCLDDGTVNRIYATDINFSTTYPTGKYIHVFNADTLAYITSFPTIDLVSGDYWNGANRITFDINTGRLYMTSEKTINDVKYLCMATFDRSGALIKHAYTVFTAGTYAGADCDENYIYFNRYTTYQGNVIYYGYVIDWDLNPVARYTIDKFDWEIECMCHIGQDLYYAWNQEAAGRPGNHIERTSFVYSIVNTSDSGPFNWPTDDGLKRNQWTIVQ